MSLVSLESDTTCRSQQHTFSAKTGGHWWAFVDEKLVAVVTATSQPELAEFRLVADGGPAWFSDMLVEELVELDTPSP
jgi:hypothetical protein